MSLHTLTQLRIKLSPSSVPFGHDLVGHVFFSYRILSDFETVSEHVVANSHSADKTITHSNIAFSSSLVSLSLSPSPSPSPSPPLPLSLVQPAITDCYTYDVCYIG